MGGGVDGLEWKPLVETTTKIARMTRASMIEALSQDYIRAARAAGLGERLIVFRLALRNALPPT